MKSALLLYGGWPGHEPKRCVERFAPWLESQGYRVLLTNSLAGLDDAAMLKEQHLIVPCWTMGDISPSQERSLLDAVRAGTGIAGWHGGMCDAFRNATEYQFMTGGQFVAHPGDIVTYTVTITRPDDPIMRGLSDFSMKSEQYYMHVDPSNEVLAATRFSGDVYPWIDGCTMPVVWKRQYGDGRVFYSSLGHAPRDFDVPECFAIMQRGMLWASR